MIARLFAVVLFCAGIFCIAQAQTSLTGAALGAPGGGGGGGCSQATTFLARTSGLSGTETSVYTTLICGLVSDGDWTHLDALYFWPTNNATTAALNLVGTSFSLVSHGSMTFNADVGYTGDGSAAFLDTQFVPSSAGGNLTNNSAAIGVYLLSSRVTGQQWSAFGSEVSTQDIELEPKWTDNNLYAEINGNTFPSAASANAQGDWAVVRTGSGAISVYKNGSIFINAASDASTGLSAESVYIFARNNAGAADRQSGDQQMALWIGDGTVNPAHMDNRLNAAATTFGINVH